MKGRYKSAETTTRRMLLTENAVSMLTAVRGDLRDAGAMKAAQAVSRALKSVQGAANHANRRWSEELREARAKETTP